MSLGPSMTFRLVSKQADSTATNSAQTEPEEPIEPTGTQQESPVRRQLRQPRSMSPPTDLDEITAEIDSAVSELRRRAYQNAPRCGGRNAHHVQEWISISQAASTFRMSKRVLSMWATQGLIASIKGDSVNSHRLVHIDGILAHMQQQLHIAKEASLRVTQDDNDMAGAGSDHDSDAVEDPMQNSRRLPALSPIILP
jgi:hypothetical protein